MFPDGISCFTVVVVPFFSCLQSSYAKHYLILPLDFPLMVHSEIIFSIDIAILRSIYIFLLSLCTRLSFSFGHKTRVLPRRGNALHMFVVPEVSTVPPDLRPMVASVRRERQKNNLGLHLQN